MSNISYCNNTGVPLNGTTLTRNTLSSSFITPRYEDLVVISSNTNNETALEVKGKIKMQNGDILDDRLERIETMLRIPIRDVAMEEKYPKLKHIWEEYNRELEKYKEWDKTWEPLK